MKKIILFSLVLVITSCSSALKIAYNSHEDGKRTVMTSNVKLFNSQSYKFDIAMGARVSKEDTILAVLVTSDKDSDHGIFDKGNRLLIRFEGGEMIALSNLYDKEFEENTETVHTTNKVTSYGYEYVYSPYFDAISVAPYEISTFVPSSYVRRTHYSYALYLLSKKQIEDICHKKVIKLRIEIEDKDLDMPNPENASAIFSELHAFLLPNILNDVKRSEF